MDVAGAMHMRVVACAKQDTMWRVFLFIEPKSGPLPLLEIGATFHALGASNEGVDHPSGLRISMERSSVTIVVWSSRHLENCLAKKSDTDTARVVKDPTLDL